MTFRVGDTATFPLQLRTIYGAALQYASASAFAADGWTLEATILGSAVTLSVSAIVPDPASLASGNFDGTHLVTCTLPAAGLLTLKAINAKTTYFPAYSLAFVICIADADSLAASIAAGVGTLIAGGSVTTVNDLNWVEGDSTQASFNVPVSSLKVLDTTNKLVFQFTSLADVSATSWTIAAQARYITENGELPASSVAFTLQSAIIDKANSIVAIGLAAGTAGAVVDDVLPAAPTVTVSGGVITGTTGGTGGHVYGTNAVTVALGGPGTGGVLTATIVNGAITGYVVANAGSGYASAPTATLSVASDGTVQSRKFAYDIQLVPPSGSSYPTAKLTVISGFINILRQQTTTP